MSTLRLAALLLLASTASAGDLVFGPPAFLPGDAAIGSPAGPQTDARVSAGGPGFLAVWVDARASVDTGISVSQGTGDDIYGALLDAAGQPIGDVAIPLHVGFGDQAEPRVSWNGQAWLVIWKEQAPGLPTYERLRGVRVAPDGTLLDAAPFTVHQDQAFYSAHVLEGGDGRWAVLMQHNGQVDGLHLTLVEGDGSVPMPLGVLVKGTLFLGDIDLAFGGDRYLVAWGSAFDPPRGRFYSTTLQPLGEAFVLPFTDDVTSDGTDFLVTYASGAAPSATVRSALVESTGVVHAPITLYTAPGQAWTCCPQAVWDGSVYWVNHGNAFWSRVSASGVLLDPAPVLLQPPTPAYSMPGIAPAPGGGVQLVWNHGVNGADYAKDVFGAQVSAPGATTPAMGPTSLVSRAAPTQMDVQVVEGPAGTHLVVFRSRDGDSARILAQRVDATGTALDAEPIEVAGGPVPGLGLPSIGAPGAAWNGSLFMITWSDGLQVFARRMWPDGTFADAAPLTVMPGFDPDVAAVGSTFLVVGVDFLFGNPQWQATHSMRVDGPTGANLDPAPNSLGGFVIFARYPHVVRFGDRWLVVWQTNVSHDNPLATTRAAFVDADGTTPGVFSPGLGWRPDVAVSDDRALFVGLDNTVASATNDLDGQIMLADGTLLPSFTVSAAAAKQLRPTAAWDGNRFVVAWEDQRDAAQWYDVRTSLWGTRVAPDGTVLDPGGVLLTPDTGNEFTPDLARLEGELLLAAPRLVTDPQVAALRVGLQRATPGPWTDVGGASSGVAGSPTLEGSGTLAGGSEARLDLALAPPGALTLAWLAFTSVPAPFFGGTLHATPFTSQFFFAADPGGHVGLTTAWPAGIPAGTQAWIQFLVQDPSVIWGITLSNAVRITTP